MVAEGSGLIGLRVCAKSAEHYPDQFIANKQTSQDVVGRIESFDVKIETYFGDDFYSIEVGIVDDEGKHWYADLEQVNPA